ncbi:MAG TPA: hypothetical protein VHH72_01475 [Solirubrobacterales bacterium]|nr:hypothetical protein [Solirubrobacterales bacterium]
MRPSRLDIAAPPFRPDLEWLGGDAPRLERIVTKGPLLVHFFDFAQVNSVRALPYVRAWHERYEPAGLTVLGIHSPRFPFTRPAEAVAGALPGLGIEWPVAVDSELATWRDYGCEGWPSLFLWGRGGALRWYQLGEGEYRGAELAIREELEPDREWPPPLDPLRETDAQGAAVIAPTPELLPGGSLAHPWRAGSEQPLRFEYESGGAFAAATGAGSLRIELEGGAAAEVAIDGPGLYELSTHPTSERHAVELSGSAEALVYSIQFAPGAPRR